MKKHQYISKTKWVRLGLFVLLLLGLGAWAEATRPACGDFDTSNMSGWSKTDYQIYADCR